jgi:hypothetical protein
MRANGPGHRRRKRSLAIRHKKHPAARRLYSCASEKNA